MKRPIVLSAISGCVWAGIAWYIMDQPTDPLIAVPILTGPLIGIVIGTFSKGFHERPILTRVVIALVTLYFATVLWGTAVGMTTFLFRSRTAWDVFAPPWVAVVVLTYGWFVVLWPLSYLNHLVIGRTWASLEIWPGWDE